MADKLHKLTQYASKGSKNYFEKNFQITLVMITYFRKSINHFNFSTI